MMKLEPQAVLSALRVVLDLENRSQQIDSIISYIKSVLAEPDALSLPETVGMTAELRWHLNNSVKQLIAFEHALGLRTRDNQGGATRRRRRRDDALRGTTRTLSIPDLLSLLTQQRKTGTLWIKSRSESFILEVLEGSVVHAMSDSAPVSQRLGTILVARNKLSMEKLDEFLSHYNADDGKIGEVMARAQLVSEEDLLEALQFQVRELFRRIFGLDHALFCFREGQVRSLEHRVCLNTTQLLLEAAHAQDEATWGDVLADEDDGDEEDTEGDDEHSGDDLEAIDGTESEHEDADPEEGGEDGGDAEDEGAELSDVEEPPEDSDPDDADADADEPATADTELDAEPVGAAGEEDSKPDSSKS